MPDSRVVTAARVEDDAQYEAGLRPRTLNEYIGQDRVRDNLEVSIAAARGRKEALDHVLLYGPPGLGKTTLGYVIGNELGVPVRATAAAIHEVLEIDDADVVVIRSFDNGRSRPVTEEHA